MREWTARVNDGHSSASATAFHPPFMTEAATFLGVNGQFRSFAGGQTGSGGVFRSLGASWHRVCITRPYHRLHFGEAIMLQWALLFLVIALLAALFGFGGLASGFATVGQGVFLVFLILFLATLLSSLFSRPPA
jgi:uncharacterized membrane protein YtjA (UPF0391 family)